MRSIRTCSNVSAYPRMAIRLTFAIRQLARSRWTRPWPKAWAKRPHRAVRVWKSCAIDLRPHQQPRKLLTFKRASSRSEEHTSELQSLMRISYAVFCLKKTKDQEE